MGVNNKREWVYIIESKTPSGLNAKQSDSEIIKTLRKANESTPLSAESYLLNLTKDISSFKAF